MTTDTMPPASDSFCENLSAVVTLVLRRDSRSIAKGSAAGAAAAEGEPVWGVGAGCCAKADPAISRKAAPGDRSRDGLRVLVTCTLYISALSGITLHKQRSVRVLRVFPGMLRERCGGRAPENLISSSLTPFVPFMREFLSKNFLSKRTPEVIENKRKTKNIEPEGTVFRPRGSCGNPSGSLGKSRESLPSGNKGN